MERFHLTTFFLTQQLEKVAPFNDCSRQCYSFLHIMSQHVAFIGFLWASGINVLSSLRWLLVKTRQPTIMA